MSKTRKHTLKLIILIIIAALVGIFIGKSINSPPEPKHDHDMHAETTQEQMYTCSMHPSVRLPDPDALCPICSMALIPVSLDQSGDPNQLVLNENAVKLAEIETVAVTKSTPQRTLRLQGEISYDETATAKIASWVDGRIDRLYADYTGMAVRKGDHMVRLYSPQLLSAQSELLQAKKALDGAYKSTNELLRNSLQANFTSSLEKLKLLGLSSSQIEDILAKNTADPFITINTPISGIVTQRHVSEGEYISTGTAIYSIADLKHLWLVMDAYEADLPWIRIGNKAEFTLKAIPGKVLSGTISFVSPILDNKARTATVRINVDNPDGLIRPGMLAVAKITARLNKDARAVSNQDYKGKYICPMHPSVITATKENCPVCQMETESAESLGYSAETNDAEELIQIPESAVLHTGRRSVVYIKEQNVEKPTFTLRTITLGAKNNGKHIVLDGLKEGELLVTRGAFKIDSERQLQNKPSMMAHMPTASEFIEIIAPVDSIPSEKTLSDMNNFLQAYVKVAGALSDDDFVEFKLASSKAADAASVFWESIKTANNDSAVNIIGNLRKHAAKLANSENINSARESFSPLSQNTQALLELMGTPKDKTYYLAQCPMAFNNTGAIWISDFDGILNPYFGKSMLKCGSILKKYENKPATIRRGIKFHE